MEWVSGPWGRFAAWFRSANRGVQVAVVMGALVVACCACGTGLGIATAASGGGSTAAQTSGAPGSTATAIPPTATPRPTVAATATATPNGPPQIGGPLARFISSYGQPFGHGYGGSDNFYADKGQTIILNVTVTSVTVTQMSVLGPTSWTNDQTFAYCAQFLPDDATEFNSVGRYTDYHSSVGEIVIQNDGQGACTLTLSQS